MHTPQCSLILCSSSAAWVRQRPPAREAIPYLCAEHRALLMKYDQEYADCYTPLEAPYNEAEPALQSLREKETA